MIIAHNDYCTQHTTGIDGIDRNDSNREQKGQYTDSKNHSPQ